MFKLKSVQLSKNTKVLNNIFALLFLQGANYLLPLITLPYLVITIGIENFGLLAFVQAIIRYFSIFVEYGFNLSATREISVHFDNKVYIAQIFSSVIFIKTFLLILSFIMLYVIVHIFDNLYIHRNIYYLTFLMIVGNTLFPIWYFQGIQKMKYITIINIISKLIFTISIFIFIKNEQDYLYVPLLNGVGYILGGIIAFFIAIKDIKFVIPRLSEIKYVFTDSTSLFISNLSVTLFTASNIFVLGVFSNDFTVGIYASIEKLTMAIKGIFGAIYQGAFPWLSKKDEEMIYNVIKILIPYFILIGLIITIPIFIFSKEILQLIYHTESITDHYYLLQFFAVGIFFSILNMLFNYLFLNAIKAYKSRMKIILISGIFNLFFGICLTYYLSIDGIVISVVATEFLLLYLGARKLYIRRYK